MQLKCIILLATSCQIVPFPPSDIGMIYTPDSANNMQLASDYSQFNPKIPFNMAVPPGGICSIAKILIVGVMPSKVRKMPEFFLMNDEGDELFHVQINKKEDVIYRWGAINKTIIETHGTPGEHTTIDYEEPFTLTIRWYQLNMFKIKTSTLGVMRMAGQLQKTRSQSFSPFYTLLIPLQ